MCGEYVNLIGNKFFDSGSPPHVWGIPQAQKMSGLVNRITPTCVGNTSFNIGDGFKREDHPHMCGEYPSDFGYTTESLGSPPHVWGIHLADNDLFDLVRITPTCVGNTNQIHHIKQSF